MANNNLKFKNNRWLNLFGTVSLAVFFLLAIAVKLHSSKLSRLDRAISLFFYERRSRNLIFAFQFISDIGRPTVTAAIIILLALVFYGNHRRILAFWLVLSTVLGNLFWQLLKIYFMRPRPLMTTMHHSFAFPSGHATSVVIFALLIFSLLPMLTVSKKIKKMMTIILWLFVLAVCFSRIYLQAHYLSDVVSGAALAFSWIIFMRHIYNKFAEKLLLAKMFR